MSTTTITIPDADVASMKTIDATPYDQSTHDTAIKLFMELMAFSAAADYSRVAVLKIGDRDRRSRVHVQRAVGQLSRRVAPAGSQRDPLPQLHRSHDAELLQEPARRAVGRTTRRPGPCWTRASRSTAIKCATGAHSFSNIPWIQAGTANGFFKKGQHIVVGTGQQPGGSQDGKAGDPSVAGMNKMLNTVLTAAGVTKTGGAPTDNFGDSSLPTGIFSELLA